MGRTGVRAKGTKEKDGLLLNWDSSDTGALHEKKKGTAIRGKKHREDILLQLKNRWTRRFTKKRGGRRKEVSWRSHSSVARLPRRKKMTEERKRNPRPRISSKQELYLLWGRGIHLNRSGRIAHN